MSVLPLRFRAYANLTALGLFACGSTLAVPLATTLKDFPGVSASMDVTEGACPPTIPVSVQAQSADAFHQGSRALLKVMGWAQVNAAVTCPDATAIHVTGTVKGETVYSGIARRNDSWTLTESSRPSLPSVAQTTVPSTTLELPAPSSSGMAAVPTFTLAKAVQQCDAVASHPDDPEAFATGVNDDRLNLKAVIQACEAAVKAEPDAPRLHFQLARGYLKADRFEDATEQLLIAAEADHGGALAYLADMHLSGAPGIEADPLLAKNLYEKAAASGFEPAKKVLDEFEDKTDMVAAAETEQQDAAAAPMAQEASSPPAFAGAKTYKRAEIIEGINKGDFDSISTGEGWTRIYLFNIADNIAAICEAHFSKSQLSELKEAADTQIFRYSNQEAMSMGLQVAMQSLKHSQEIMAKGQAETPDYAQLAFEESMNDTSVFLTQNGCKGPVIERFSKNLTAYIKDAPDYPNDALIQTCTGAHMRIAYCRCFAAITQNAAVSRRLRRELMAAVNFQASTVRIADENKGMYFICN